MTSRYFLILEESREGFEALVDLLKSDLLLEAEAVYESPSLYAQVLLSKKPWVDITAKAAFEWAGSKDIDDWGYIPPMFETPLADLISAWRDFHEFGGLDPNGEPVDTTERDELDMLHTL